MDTDSDFFSALNISTNQPLKLVTGAPILQITAPDHRVLLTLNTEDGKLVAKYDPADLDEAAQTFIDAMLQQFNA